MGTPVPVYGIEGRYAAALFSAASKNGSLEAVEKDLKSISSTMESDPRLGSFLLDPSIKNHIKLDGISGVCKTLKVSDLSKNLLEALAENNRLGFTNAVVSSFATLMAAHRGEVVLRRHHCQGARRGQQEGGGGCLGWIPQVRREGSYLLLC